VEWADHSSGFICNADNVYYVKFRRIGSGYPQAEPGAWRRVPEWPSGRVAGIEWSSQGGTGFDSWVENLAARACVPMWCLTAGAARHG